MDKKDMIDTLYKLSLAARVDSNFLDENIYDQEVIVCHKKIYAVTRFIAELWIMGLPLRFMMQLSEKQAALMVMLADGKLIEEIEEQLSTDADGLLAMRKELLEILNRQANELSADEIQNVKICLNDFLKEEIESEE